MQNLSLLPNFFRKKLEDWELVDPNLSDDDEKSDWNLIDDGDRSVWSTFVNDSTTFANLNGGGGPSLLVKSVGRTCLGMIAIYLFLFIGLIGGTTYNWVYGPVPYDTTSDLNSTSASSPGSIISEGVSMSPMSYFAGSKFYSQLTWSGAAKAGTSSSSAFKKFKVPASAAKVTTRTKFATVVPHDAICMDLVNTKGLVLMKNNEYKKLESTETTMSLSKTKVTVLMSDDKLKYNQFLKLKSNNDGALIIYDAPGPLVEITSRIEGPTATPAKTATTGTKTKTSSLNSNSNSDISKSTSVVLSSRELVEQCKEIEEVIQSVTDFVCDDEKSNVNTINGPGTGTVTTGKGPLNGLDYSSKLAIVQKLTHGYDDSKALIDLEYLSKLSVLDKGSVTVNTNSNTVNTVLTNSVVKNKPTVTEISTNLIMQKFVKTLSLPVLDNFKFQSSDLCTAKKICKLCTKNLKVPVPSADQLNSNTSTTNAAANNLNNNTITNSYNKLLKQYHQHAAASAFNLKPQPNTKPKLFKEIDLSSVKLNATAESAVTNSISKMMMSNSMRKTRMGHLNSIMDLFYRKPNLNLNMIMDIDDKVKAIQRAKTSSQSQSRSLTVASANAQSHFKFNNYRSTSFFKSNWELNLRVGSSNNDNIFKILYNMRNENGVLNDLISNHWLKMYSNSEKKFKSEIDYTKLPCFCDADIDVIADTGSNSTFDYNTCIHRNVKNNNYFNLNFNSTVVTNNHNDMKVPGLVTVTGKVSNSHTRNTLNTLNSISRLHNFSSDAGPGPGSNFNSTYYYGPGIRTRSNGSFKFKDFEKFRRSRAAKTYRYYQDMATARAVIAINSYDTTVTSAE